MSENRYKIVINGKNIYKEHILSKGECTEIEIGTEMGCQVRLNKDLFFQGFKFRIVKKESCWQIYSSDSVYFTIDNVMKLHSKELEHGDEIIVKYNNLNEEIFTIYFLIDFDSVEKNFNRTIDISSITHISIGGNEQNNIYIEDNLTKKGQAVINVHNNQYYIKDEGTQYGVYVNSKIISKETPIKDYDFINIAGYYFYFKDKKLYTEANDTIKIKSLKYEDEKSINMIKYPKFNRNPRIKHLVPKCEIEVLPPEKLGEEPKGRLLMSLIPALVMLAVTIVLRGIMGNGGTFIYYSVISMSLGIVMSIITAISNKKEYKKQVKEREEKYLEYIKQKEKVIQEFRNTELQVNNKIYTDIIENIDNINNFHGNLFERDYNDEDFLHVKLGKGQVYSKCNIKVTSQEFKDTRDTLAMIPEEIMEKYRVIENMPVISKLRDLNAIGVIGEYDELLSVSRNITIDIIARQFYKDVKLFYIFHKEKQCDYEWLRWLKHIENEELGIRNLIYDEESKKILFEYLYKVLLKREQINSNSKEKVKHTHIIVFLLSNNDLYTHPIARFIENSKEYGVTFIFFEKSKELLPKGCEEILELKGNNIGTWINCHNGEEFVDFNYKYIGRDKLEEIAIKMAPIFVDEVSLESQLTKNISLYQLLNIYSEDDLDMEKRWNESKVYESMAAPLGVKTKNEVVYLDLNEKKHGPHGLVAGTTGSGKSEIVQSYILSMATLFHPYEVGFVIIDFKGGGMVNQFKDLPHLVGAITNIDGKEIDRSLLSIKAELNKRQQLFAEYDVNHIDAYIKKFKSGETKYPLPHLILIVDEFAELKSNQPEFMKELISAARIGRSLGVHLILATQKPSGVVDEQIWSNSKFKLCLKVQNKRDSEEILKSPLAAEIKEPGRAYLQVGNNEIFELFQSAYSGATAVNDNMDNQRDFQINEVSLWGERNIVYKTPKSNKDINADTQLKAVVDYINKYCKHKNIERLPGICLPPLPDVINIDKGTNIEKNNLSVEIAIGMYDDPSSQLQAPVKLNLSEGNLFILGSSQYGKTSLIQTIVRTVAYNYSPNEVNLYILDFASMVLKNFDGLRHVGGVITSSEDEKLKTFMKMIMEEIENRKSILSSLGISSYVSYKEAGYMDIPQIIICLDNMTAFKELYPQRDEELLRICREGVSLGITVIMANSQTNGIGYKYMTNFSNRIALYCNDATEYGSLFDRCRMKPENIPGRGLVSIDKNVYEYQNYLAFSGDKEIERVEGMKKFIKEINKNYLGMKAKIIPEIPKLLDMDYIESNFGMDSLEPYEIPIGLNFDTINVQTINLLKEQSIVIKGKEGRGKSNFLMNIANNINKKILENQVQAYIIDDMNKKLGFMDDYGFVYKYTLQPNGLESAIDELYEELEYRNERVSTKGKEALEKMPLLLVINNNVEAMDSLAANKAVMEKYKKIMGIFKDLKICIIFNNLPNVSVGFGASELLKLIKNDQKAFIFDELQDDKFYGISLSTIKTFKKKLDIGDAYGLNGDEVVKIKTILSN